MHDDRVINIRARRKQRLGKRISALVLTGVGVFLFMIVGITGGEMAVGAALCLLLVTIGVAPLVVGRSNLTSDILQLARAQQGTLTLTEIVTSLEVSPGRALRVLRALGKTGIATQRWEEIHKNIWEFPDYLELPIRESLNLAERNGGRVNLKDLVAHGQTPEVARQTLDTLSQKGLARFDPTTPDQVLTADGSADGGGRAMGAEAAGG